MNQRLWLRNARLRKHLTSKQLADKIGISEAYYKQIENGERQVNMDRTLAIRISDALGISVAKIYHAEEESFFLADSDTVLAIEQAKDILTCVITSGEDKTTKENALWGVNTLLEYICDNIDKDEILREQIPDTSECA